MKSDLEKRIDKYIREHGGLEKMEKEFDKTIRSDLVRRLRKAAERGPAGAGGYGKDSINNLLKEAAVIIEMDLNK